MTFLEEMKATYGSYGKAVSSLKKKIRNTFEKGVNNYCLFEDTPEIMEKLANDKEFEGITFKEATKVTPEIPGRVVKLVCWN